MLLVEADGKALLRRYGIAVPEGEVISSADWSAPAGPRVVKAQVPVGGRGKAGGIIRCDTVAEPRRPSRGCWAAG